MRFSLIMQRGKGNGSNKHSSLLPPRDLAFLPREFYDVAHPLVTLAACILEGKFVSCRAFRVGGVTGRGEGRERTEGRFDAVIDIIPGKGEEPWSWVTCNPLD